MSLWKNVEILEKDSLISRRRHYYLLLLNTEMCQAGVGRQVPA